MIRNHNIKLSLENMSPIKMELTLEKRISYGGQPVLSWGMDNIHVKTNPAGNIKDGQENVSEIMKNLNNPPEEYKSIYDTVMDMYTAYQSITDLAVNPQGNIQSFNDNKRERIDKFMELYKKNRSSITRVIIKYKVLKSI